MSVQYTGGVQYNEDVQYTGGIMSIVGDIMSSLADGMIKCGGRSLEKQLNLYGHPPPVYSMISPPVFSMISHQCTEHPPPPPPVYCTDIMQGDNFNLQFHSMPG